MSDYWDDQYHQRPGSHSEQNVAIARDFFSNAASHPVLMRSLADAGSILEVGCGTGEMCRLIHETWPSKEVLGTDACRAAIDEAKLRNKGLSFVFADVTLPLLPQVDHRFDIVVCSHVLEHFKNPWPVVDNMLGAAGEAIIIVPNDQPVTDGYAQEGGAGHVFQFTLDSLSERYEVLDSLLFASDGWQCSNSELILTVLLTASGS